METKTPHEIFTEKTQAISNKELSEKASEIISSLCKTGGRSFNMTVPPSINDSDIILSELVKRFAAGLKEASQPSASLEGVKRYELNPIINGYHELQEIKEVIHENGDWVKFDDIANLLTAKKEVPVSEPSIDQFAIHFAEWYRALQPMDRVSVWSKDGSKKGIFEMDAEQMLAKYKEKFPSPQPLVEVTVSDEEIEKVAFELKPNSKRLDDNIARNSWVWGAKWMREKFCPLQ